jgi:hypothetical protein
MYFRLSVLNGLVTERSVLEHELDHLVGTRRPKGLLNLGPTGFTYRTALAGVVLEDLKGVYNLGQRNGLVVLIAVERVGVDHEDHGGLLVVRRGPAVRRVDELLECHGSGDAASAVGSLGLDRY